MANDYFITVDRRRFFFVVDGLFLLLLLLLSLLMLWFLCCSGTFAKKKFFISLLTFVTFLTAVPNIPVGTDCNRSTVLTHGAPNSFNCSKQFLAHIVVKQYELERTANTKRTHKK